MADVFPLDELAVGQLLGNEHQNSPSQVKTSNTLGYGISLLTTFTQKKENSFHINFNNNFIF